MLTLHDELTIGSNLFNAPERYKVVTVNCVGAMGKGIALECRNRYTQLYNGYRAACRQDLVRIGQVDVYLDECVILLPTKTHFKYPSDVSYVTSGLESLAYEVDAHELEGGIALPPLGMANGWLGWHDRNEIYHALYQILNGVKEHYAIYLPTRLLREAEKALRLK